jgi:hypothetical protein
VEYPECTVGGIARGSTKHQAPSSVVKPYVQCSNIDSLADALLGYQKVVISHAARRGGASKISFGQ